MINRKNFYNFIICSCKDLSQILPKIYQLHLIYYLNSTVMLIQISYAIARQRWITYVWVVASRHLYTVEIRTVIFPTSSMSFVRILSSTDWQSYYLCILSPIKPSLQESLKLKKNLLRNSGREDKIWYFLFGMVVFKMKKELQLKKYM